MAILTSPLLQGLRTSFQTSFQDGFDTAESLYESVATLVPSTTRSNTYGWLGKWPGFREWVGDRVFKNMAEHGYSVTNKDWESTVAVARTDIEDDNLGVYTPMMKEMGYAAKVWPDELIFSLLKAGNSKECFDGQSFFDTDHPVYPNVDGTGTPVTVSNYQDGTGPAWFLMDTKRALKPLIFQERKKPVFTSMTSLTDESVFMSNMFRFGVDSRSNVGFGFWQQAFMSKAELTVANFQAAYEAMTSLVSDGGRPLNIKPNILVVPPNLRAPALKICEAALVNGGDTNINAGVVKPIVTAWVL